jgi:cytidine deaminase
MPDDTRTFNRRTLLAALAATSTAMVMPAAPVEATPMQPDLAALLETLKPVGGVIPAERVRAANLPLPDLMKRLIPWAKAYADPPISQFFVGAIVEGVSGALYAGMNLEFPGQTLAFSVHGEAAATTNAWLHGETGIVSLAVGGEPCGYCRQFLSEFVRPERLAIWMPDGGSVTLADALPRAFLPAVLGVHVDPFHARQTLKLAEATPDPLVQAALVAANLSHAPYSHTYAGIALRLKNGSIVTGRHAENVAYNPGMPPLQAALVALRLGGYEYGDITAAALAQADGRASQRTATEAVLATISQAPLEYARLEAA